MEVGCGTGLFTQKVSTFTGSAILGTDISPELISIARERAAKSHSDCSFQIENAMNLSFADNSIDVIFGSSVLHHLDTALALGEFYRVLRPETGRIVFAEPNMLNPQILVQKNIPIIKRWLGDSPDETAIVRWKLARQLEELGYCDVKITPHDFLHPWTPKFAIPFVSYLGTKLEKVPIIREIAGSVLIYARKHS